jgi:hypothetical protein
MDSLYASVTGVTNPLNITVSESHSSSTSTAIIECLSHSLNIGDYISVDLGYVTNHAIIFRGYVKEIDRAVPQNTYNIIAHDVMIRAVDFFVASTNPDQPFSRNDIKAETLVRDVLELAGLTDYDYDATNFTLAINTVAEVNLVSAYDYCNGIAELLAWHLYADKNGQVHFVDRKPYVVGGDTSVYTVDSNNLYNIISFTHKLSERDLRNRVVVYGSTGIYAEAKQATSYNPLTSSYEQILPTGFYKTAVAASPLINQTSLAQQAADYNLDLYNRLGSNISLSILGSHSVEARTVITVDESITGISGDYYVYLVEHTWGADGYIVNMDLRK